jgi:hypothetical protein
MWFAFGIALAVTSFGLSYLANFSYASANGEWKRIWLFPYLEKVGRADLWRNWGKRAHIGAILLGAGSLALFLYGVWSMKTAILGLA